ncbi:MAG: metal-dependent hydrolase [Bacteroidota bacterium]
MDSLTQIALGAAVGEAVLGKEEGNKAMLWGAIAGTIPDLDILIYPFVTEVQQLAIHRGLSHSILFAVLAPIPMGMLLSKIYKQSSHWTRWGLLLFWSFFTHALLDSFTNYGTQLFYPFSDYPVSFDTIFIIDLLYTLPLVIGLIAALWLGRKDKARRRRANQLGLLLSSLYLIFTLCNKVFIHKVFEDALVERGISHEQLFSNPSPLNNILWYGVADDGDNLWVGTYSWFDPDRNITFKQVPKNKERLLPYLGQEPIERLLWFSKGFYTIDQVDSTLYLNDLRFPRSDMYLDNDGAYVFSFELIPDPDNPDTIINFKQGGNTPGVTPNILDRFVARVKGNRDA